MKTVFISYKRQDEPFARRLRQQLAAWGISPWLDVVDIHPGDDWDTAIHQGLKTADAVIGILTPESLASRNVLDEWGYALTTGKPFFLLWLRPVDEIDIPPRYIRIQRIRLIDDEEAGLDRLREALAVAKAAAPVPQRRTTSQRILKPATVQLPSPYDSPPQPYAPPIIGIDFGTTNSLCAITEGGKTFILDNQNGYPSTPSAVMVDLDGSLIAGDRALSLALQYPERSVLDIKRLLGQNLALYVDGKEYPLPLLASAVFKRLKEDVDAYFGASVSAAVVTAPAYFNQQQLEDIRTAAYLAGLDVFRIVEEPVAACSACFGTSEQGIVAIFDLGGGTFDISILEVGDGVYEVRSVYGDNQLGGLDFDMALVRYCIDNVREQTGIDLSDDLSAQIRLRDACERAKKDLTILGATEIAVPHLISDPLFHLSLRITREEFDALTRHLVDRAIECCKVALRDAGLEPSDIQRLVLVGLPTRTPGLRDAAINFFGVKPTHGIDPDKVVALGAAVQAGVLQGEIRDILTLQVTNFTYALELADGTADPVIERNTVIPTRKVQTYTTARDGQTYTWLHILQGDHPLAADNILIGKLLLGPIPAAAAGTRQIEVTFDIDANGILAVWASETETKVEVNRTVNRGKLHDESPPAGAVIGLLQVPPDPPQVPDTLPS